MLSHFLLLQYACFFVVVLFYSPSPLCKTSESAGMEWSFGQKKPVGERGTLPRVDIQSLELYGGKEGAQSLVKNTQ